MRYKLIGIILVILFSFSALPVAHAQEVIYFMRHAEQVLDVEDPPLTEVGHRRAEAWASILRNAGIKVVYTSKKKRTRQTGEPIAKALNIPLESMPRSDVAGLVDRLRTGDDEAVLIISHIRTIPKLFKELGVSETVEIPRDEYGNLIIVVLETKNDPIVLRLGYE
jgi:phosphohistidine phosphatase SixA